MTHWLLPTFGAFFFWGFTAFLPKLTVRYLSPKSALLFETLGGMIVAFIILSSLKFKPDLHPKGILLAMTSGALAFSGALCFYYAASKGPISLVATVSGLSPVMPVLLAMIVLREPLSVKQGLGIVLGILSMALIAA
jgi:bacterial/archaeal transporter family protein